jgi:succinate dehydrogenase/fumarate reductase flavoprotein subunit
LRPRDHPPRGRRRRACHRRYGNVYNLSTYARQSNGTAAWRSYKRGAGFANPLHPDPSDLHPVSGDYQSKLTLMSRVAPQRRSHLVPKKKEDCKKNPNDIPEEDRDYYLERKYPSFGNLAPRDISSRAAKQVCDEGRGVGETGLGVYLDFADAINRYGKQAARVQASRIPRRRRSASSARPPSPSATAISSTSTTRSPTRTPTRCRCASIRRSTTRWAVSGSTTT